MSHSRRWRTICVTSGKLLENEFNVGIIIHTHFIVFKITVVIFNYSLLYVMIAQLGWAQGEPRPVVPAARDVLLLPNSLY